MKIRSSILWGLCVLVAVVFGYLLGSAIKGPTTYVAAQTDEKSFSLASTVNAQFKFKKIRVGHTDREIKRGFVAGPDWLKDINFEVENISKKPVVFLQVNLNFPETRETGGMLSYPVTFGLRPNSKLVQRNSPKTIQPGESVEIRVAEIQQKLFKYIKERQPVESINKVELEIGFVIFDDKTAWTAGTFMLQDEENPDIYRPLLQQN